MDGVNDVALITCSSGTTGMSKGIYYFGSKFILLLRKFKVFSSKFIDQNIFFCLNINFVLAKFNDSISSFIFTGKFVTSAC